MVEIDAAGRCLVALPMLVEGHQPMVEALPLFLFKLATETRWDEEELCFRDVAQHLAALYARTPPRSVAAAAEAAAAAGEGAPTPDDRHPATKVLQRSVFPAIQSALDPPHKFADDQTVVELACLQNLYKIFERC